MIRGVWIYSVNCMCVFEVIVILYGQIYVGPYLQFANGPQIYAIKLVY